MSNLEALTPQEEQRILAGIPRCLLCGDPAMVGQRDTPDICDRCVKKAEAKAKEQMRTKTGVRLPMKGDVLIGPMVGAKCWGCGGDVLRYRREDAWGDRDGDFHLAARDYSLCPRCGVSDWIEPGDNGIDSMEVSMTT